MILVKAIASVTFVLLALTAWTQEFPAAELEFDYSYALHNPSPYSSLAHLNGGGGSATLNINSYFGITIDLHGFGSTAVNFNIPVNATFPKGVNGTVDGKISTYLLGPQFKFRAHDLQPFVRGLVGGAHTHLYRDAFTAFCQHSCELSTAPGNNQFAAELGGGIDVPVNKWVTFRPLDVSYLITGFSNPFTNNSHPHNFRYTAGVVFTLDRTLY
jgi:hypothetical protein